jgi:hypothetical protein
MFRKALLVAVSSACVLSAHAEQRIIGNWLLIVEPDRFSGGNTVVATTAQADGLFAVRCIQQIFTLAVTVPGAERFNAGDPFKIKFKADANPVVETTGDAVNESIVEIIVTPDIRQTLAAAKEYALRVTTPAGTQFDSLFAAGDHRALSEALKACPAKK